MRFRLFHVYDDVFTALTTFVLFVSCMSHLYTLPSGTASQATHVATGKHASDLRDRFRKERGTVYAGSVHERQRVIQE